MFNSWEADQRIHKAVETHLFPVLPENELALFWDGLGEPLSTAWQVELNTAAREIESLGARLKEVEKERDKLKESHKKWIYDDLCRRVRSAEDVVKAVRGDHTPSHATPCEACEALVAYDKIMKNRFVPKSKSQERRLKIQKGDES